ncbi:hypothetical protein [Larkinella punicea]|uniref:DUF4421 domain-containing protein n=1 Tax=Larkinella punicea TaxID=2315727 RepID=A0A368JDK3_9BACT|nr:hypothetical protein [Larkinella punicea]RCR65612.1 hypothetical protein DUE52_30900 [Larkinella punicea]
MNNIFSYNTLLFALFFVSNSLNALGNNNSFQIVSTLDTVSIEKNKYKENKIGFYSFTMIDYSDNLFTMRQFNQGYLSLYRLSSQLSYKHTSKKYQFLILPIQAIFSLYFTPLTHEEGHRSVLTNLTIGSVSAPLFKKNVAKVTGVTDETLKKLRDNQLPYYIRLHTAGIESDYMLCQKEEELVFFNQEKLRNVAGDYYMRKVGIVLYYTFSAFSRKNSIEKEEINELDRDIVGDDVRGAVRHLYRPNMPFYRYTSNKDLTSQERKFIHKAGYLSLLNLLSPLMISKTRIKLNNNLNAGFGLGYIMAPFGGMIEENLWLNYAQKYNMHAFIRQFENKEKYFWAGGIALHNYSLSKKISLTSIVQVWSQPENLDFYALKGLFGHSGALLLSYRIFGKENSPLAWWSFDISGRVKTKGFVPEDPSLEKSHNLSFGLSFCPR